MKNSERTIDFFNKVSNQNLELIDTFYHNDIHFLDPFHEIQGRSEFKKYMTTMYENTLDCKFDLTHSIDLEGESIAFWTMRLKHKRIKGGQEIVVTGNSHLKFKDDQLIYHRDYFDTTEMLFEHLPIIGHGIKLIKSRI